MKKLINICSLCLISICLSATSAFGQAVFNDTILFQITGIEQINNGFKYFLEFETQGTGLGNPEAFRGIGVLSMCSCYCDSIWDAWPKDPGVIPGGGTIMTLGLGLQHLWLASWRCVLCYSGSCHILAQIRRLRC